MLQEPGFEMPKKNINQRSEASLPSPDIVAEWFGDCRHAPEPAALDGSTRGAQPTQTAFCSISTASRTIRSRVPEPTLAHPVRRGTSPGERFSERKPRKTVVDKLLLSSSFNILLSILYPACPRKPKPHAFSLTAHMNLLQSIFFYSQRPGHLACPPFLPFSVCQIKYTVRRTQQRERSNDQHCPSLSRKYVRFMSVPPQAKNVSVFIQTRSTRV